jgi:hypothetical protein
LSKTLNYQYKAVRSMVSPLTVDMILQIHTGTVFNYRVPYRYVTSRIFMLLRLHKMTTFRAYRYRHIFCLEPQKIIQSSVADPDPGSGAFLPPGSGCFYPRSRIRPIFV